MNNYQQAMEIQIIAEDQKEFFCTHDRYILNDYNQYINIGSLYRERDLIDEIESNIVLNYNIMIRDNQTEHEILNFNDLLNDVVGDRVGFLRREIQVLRFLENKHIFRIDDIRV